MEDAPYTQFFTTADARAWGMEQHAVARAVRSGLWHRIRRGYFTAGETWKHLDEVGRHRLRARVVVHSMGGAIALSHVSAVLEHGIAVWGVPLDRVHVTRLDGGAGRIDRDVVHHEGFCDSADVVTVGAIPVLSPARSALEAGTLVSSEKALVILDSALALGLATRSDVERQFDTMRHWPGKQRLHLPVRMADAGSQSPGESRARWLFQRGGIPAPQLQYVVRDSRGQVIGTSDWGWPHHRMLGEFDGRGKYGLLLRPDQDPGEVVFAEKQREDRMREATGFGMIRLTWDDLSRPQSTLARLRRQLGLRAA